VVVVVVRTVDFVLDLSMIVVRWLVGLLGMMRGERDLRAATEDFGIGDGRRAGAVVFGSGEGASARVGFDGEIGFVATVVVVLLLKEVLVGDPSRLPVLLFGVIVDRVDLLIVVFTVSLLDGLLPGGLLRTSLDPFILAGLAIGVIALSCLLLISECTNKTGCGL
jgi:hypothetical protein